jgi:hypothetical protein
MRIAAFVIPLLLIACSHSPAAPTATPTPATRPPVAAAPAPDDAHTRVVDGLVGAWVGEATDTPVGPFPFAIAFAREAGGDVHGRADDGKGTYLDFRFRREGARWTLVEEGQLPGAGKQAHTLDPAAATADGVRWAERGEPDYLSIAFALDGDALVLTATVHGEPHAAFRLRRAGDATAAPVARVE